MRKGSIVSSRFFFFASPLEHIIIGYTMDYIMQLVARRPMAQLKCKANVKLNSKSNYLKNKKKTIRQTHTQMKGKSRKYSQQPQLPQTTFAADILSLCGCDQSRCSRAHFWEGTKNALRAAHVQRVLCGRSSRRAVAYLPQRVARSADGTATDRDVALLWAQ